MELLAGRLHAEEPCHVLYATARLRTQESAEILSGRLGLPVRVESGLTGPHHGAASCPVCPERAGYFRSFPDRVLNPC